jgi:hypothetical protein
VVIFIVLLFLCYFYRFVCTSVVPLQPGEIPIAVNNNDDDDVEGN